MAKYHLNERGEPGLCRARKACPFGDLAEDHYGSLEEARASYEATMQQATFAKPTPVTLTSAMVERMPVEQQRLVVGAIQRCEVDSISLDNPEVAYWQAAYDSSPAGQLWLARKREERAPNEEEHPEYLERKANVEKFLRFSEKQPMPLDLPEDPGSVLDSEFSPPEPQVVPDPYGMSAQKTKLALLSAAWISNLSPEEVEAVSWVTSNGASVMNQHLSGEEPEIWGYEEYPIEHIDRQVKHFRAAMAKAPELDEPVIIYRGTGAEHGETEFLDRPASASASCSTAQGFRNGKGEKVLLEIKTRKVAAAVGMSAWTNSELEVLAPLGEYRKVGEFVTMRGAPVGGYRTEEFNPAIDTIRIIQLEYVGTNS